MRTELTFPLLCSLLLLGQSQGDAVEYHDLTQSSVTSYQSLGYFNEKQKATQRAGQQKGEFCQTRMRKGAFESSGVLCIHDFRKIQIHLLGG